MGHNAHLSFIRFSSRVSPFAGVSPFSRGFATSPRGFVPRRSHKWFRLTAVGVGTGITVVALQVLRYEYKKREINQENDQVVKRPVLDPWQLHVLNNLPLRAISRLWGTINNEYNLPVWMRKPCYKFYSWLFNCKLDEIENPDLKTYPNLGAFFYRSLKSGSRQIDNNAILVSPSDGRIISFGLVNDGWIEPIKGDSYTLSALLGRDNINNTNDSNDLEVPIHISPDNPYKWQVNKKENGLFYCTIYLAPGDYHHFHSPTNWVVESRRHFVGELFSVSPLMLKLLPDLFVLNERVALLGRWKHGFFAMIPVGSTNVGSIRINFDQALRTNQKGAAVGTYTEMSYKNTSEHVDGHGQPLRIGEEMGGFRLGSTMILIFEAPLNFKFCVTPEQITQVGRKLGEDGD